jgi:hypothetical protein
VYWFCLALLGLDWILLNCFASPLSSASRQPSIEVNLETCLGTASRVAAAASYTNASMGACSAVTAPCGVGSTTCCTMYGTPAAQQRQAWTHAVAAAAGGHFLPPGTQTVPQPQKQQACTRFCTNCGRRWHHGGHVHSHSSLSLLLSSPEPRAAANLGASLLWMLDSGATKRICNIMHAMLHVRPAPGWSVACAAGQHVPVHGIGDALFDLPNGQLLLQEVLLVPSMSTSLLSISDIDTAGFSALCQGGCCPVHCGAELVLVAPRSVMTSEPCARPGGGPGSTGDLRSGVGPGRQTCSAAASAACWAHRPACNCASDSTTCTVLCCTHL